MTDDDVPGDDGTTGSPWNHHICEACWSKMHPGRWPVRIRDDAPFQSDEATGEVLIRAAEVAFQCCYCGSMCWSHILYRDDPGQRHCRHDMYVTAGSGG